MIIISHRGYWKTVTEKNTRVAFERSFSLGFGTETDLRDHNSKLVISHDMPGLNAMPLEEFFDIYKEIGNNLPLALNIKSDGLQEELRRHLLSFDVRNYFVFDMAVPDGLAYAKKEFNTYTRQSEFEALPAYYELANGVWLDEFLGHWITDKIVEDHLHQGKALCIVSPELHKHDNANAWQHYHQLEKKIGFNRLMLCTDYPEQAMEYFNA